MASPKVVTTNADLPRQSSVCSLSSLLADPSKSITMDDLLKSICSSEPNPNPEPAATSIPRNGSFSLPKDMAAKTVDEVWKEIVAGTDPHSQSEEMTLEDFLAKAGAVKQDDVTALPATAAATMLAPPHFPIMEGNGIEGTTTVTVVGVGGGGRGKRRAVEHPVLDKATLQKQRRMIKNRESAARSRERKQAYTVELESLVTHLEEENARLLKEEADKNKQRFKQLMECLIPVVEKRKPRRMLRRVNSVQW